MLLMMSVSILISVTLIFVNFVLAKKEFNEREKPSPFECGFDPISSARLPFSIQFFLIAVIFLIFDIELTLILPSVVVLFSSNLSITIIMLMLFLVILLGGLYIEWNQKALEWYI